MHKEITKNKHLLFIDPNPVLLQQFTQYFQTESFIVTTANTGDSALSRIKNQTFDVIILELMIQKPHGFDLLTTIRNQVKTPLIILTARKDEVDQLLAFEMGADDYLQKPCDISELFMRIIVLLRRNHTQHVITSQPSMLAFENFVVDCAARHIKMADKVLELTNTEFNLMRIFIQTPGHAFSKEALTEYALERKYAAHDRSIDVHISNLRNKLGPTPTGETWIKTIRGFGYLFNA